MSDYRKEFVESVERSLINVLTPESIEIVSRKITCALGDYEITKRSTELVVYDDANEQMLKRYCACLLVEGKSKGTIYGYRRCLERFFEFIGKPYSEIGPYDIRYYLGMEKERGIKDVTLENTRSYIASFFTWLSNEDIIQKNPCGVIKPIKVSNEDKQAFSAVEMDALRHACQSERERAIIEVLSSSGVRVAELCNLDISDINTHDMTVHVRNGKGGKYRTTFISDVAKMHLQMYLRTRPEDGEAVFYNEHHARLQAGGVRNILARIAKRAGVSNVHPHRFRRTLATGLAKRGMPIQEIQKILGHSDINTTMRYVCVDDTKTMYSYKQHIA